MGAVPVFEPLTPGGEGKAAQILAADLQRIIEAHMNRIVLQHGAGDGLAVEPLLQVTEGRHLPLRTTSNSPSSTASNLK